MAQLFEGECIGKPVNVEFGADNKTKKPKVRWEMLVLEGEHKGKRASYSGKFDTDNIKFTKRDMIAIGWKGVDVSTFLADVKASELPVPFTAEIASTTYEDTGKTSEWTSAKFKGGVPLAALDKDKIADVNKWFAEAGDIAPPSQPTNGATSAPVDDIPF